MLRNMRNMKNLIQNVYMLPFRIFKDITFDVYLLSDKKKKIVYITSISVGKTPYFIERLCGNDATITKIKRIYVWELRKFVNQQDMVCVDMHKYLARFFNNGMLVPELVTQVLNIDKSLDEAIKLEARELKKVHKFSHEISNDYGALKFFYDKMYVPHIKKRYGDSAVENFRDFEKIFRNGELVFVKLGNEYVSAYLCKIDGDTYHCRKNGVLNETYLKEGALIAAYYFSILRAKDTNAKFVDFGGSKPFLLDGVLRHKNHWGTRICLSDRTKRMIYLKNVLFEQPFIYIEDEKLKAIIFSESDKLVKEYVNSGLEFKVIRQER